MARTLVCLLSFLALTGAALAKSTPALVGTWEGPSRAKLINAVTTGQFVLIIDEQDRELFLSPKTVTRYADHEGLVTANNERVRNANEQFIGVTAADGESFYLAEACDPGWYTGRILGSDTIELNYVESGDDPIVHRTTLTRQD